MILKLSKFLKFKIFYFFIYLQEYKKGCMVTWTNIFDNTPFGKKPLVTVSVLRVI